jgi:cutinase-like protein
MGIDIACIRRIASLVSAATVTAGALLAAPISTPSAAADGCPDIEVVFARGTDDPPGVGGVGQAFIDSLRSKVGGRSVGQYAVNYAATMNFLRVADGVNDANNHVNYMIGNCPATRLVIGGYSQGAAVVDFLVGVNPGLSAIPGVGSIPGLDAIGGLGGVAPPLSPDAANHVAAVATFGNPVGKVMGPLPGLSPVYGGRTIDLCNAGDPICGPGNIQDRVSHHQYAPGGTDQASSFAAGLV